MKIGIVDNPENFGDDRKASQQKNVEKPVLCGLADSNELKNCSFFSFKQPHQLYSFFTK
jgi:hypothetical protein